MDDFDHLAALIVEACALVERAERRGLDDAGWAALTHLRAQLCLLASEAADAETADAAGEIVCCIGAVLQRSPAVQERGAA